MGLVVHKRDPHDVYIGRPSKWGNPFSHKERTLAEYQVKTRKEAVAAYRIWLWKRIKSGEVTLQELDELYGKVLGCWCAPKECHGDVLVKAAEWAHNELEKQNG